jgi:hypothetical protein
VRPEPGYLKLIDSSKPNEDDEDDEFVQTPAQAQRVGDILRGLPPDLKKYIMEGPPKTAFSRRGQQELLNQCIKRIRSLFRKCRTIPSGDLKDKCKDFPFHTFTRACKQLGVIKRRIGGLGSKGQWVAEMPKRGTKADISARPAP